MASVLPQDLPLGAILDDRYKLIRLLGRGGMGNVYQAEETRLRRRYTLKVLHPQFAQDRSCIERFLREAQILAQLEHPSIVDIHAYGEDRSGAVFFTMELLEGEDLDARISARAERPYSVYEACAWAVQIARAVAVVHGAGIIHRDLKCSNVFLARRKSGDEVVKLLDFGIARAEDSSDLTKTGTTLGTPNYMAPEQVRCLAVDRRVDIYSFGVVLYKALTGKLPFIGEPIQVAMQQCERVPVRPSVAAPQAGISAAIEAMVLKAMEKRPEDRFQSMLEVEQALLAVLAAEAPNLAGALEPTRVFSASDLVGTSANSGADRQVAPEPGPQPTAGAGAEAGLPVPDAATTQSPVTNGSTIAMQGASTHGIPRWLSLLSFGSTLCVTTIVALVYVKDMNGPSGDGGAGTPIQSVGSAPRTPSSAAVAASAAVAPVATQTPEPPPPAPVPRPGVPTTSATTSVVPPASSEKSPATKPPAPPAEASPRTVPPASVDPAKAIRRKAKTCRVENDAVAGPAITILYSVGSDGAVISAEAPVADALGMCLVRAVKSAKFKPVFAMGLEITL